MKVTCWQRYILNIMYYEEQLTYINLGINSNALRVLWALRMHSFAAEDEGLEIQI